MVSRKTVAKLMRAAGLAGIPRPQTRKNPKVEVRSEDLVNRNFLRTQPNLLWVCDITEHPTREGKLYCCAVLDAFSRKIVGGSIDNSQNTTLVVNALEMAISNRDPKPGNVFHSGHGVQFTSWTFTSRVKAAGLMPSLGTVGDGYDNAMMESFWSKMQTELLDRRKWKTRTELANEIFQYLEIFHNRQRRHSKLGYLTPVEYERLHELQQPLHRRQSEEPGQRQSTHHPRSMEPGVRPNGETSPPSPHHQEHAATTTAGTKPVTATQPPNATSSTACPAASTTACPHTSTSTRTPPSPSPPPLRRPPRHAPQPHSLLPPRALYPLLPRAQERGPVRRRPPLQLLHRPPRPAPPRPLTRAGPAPDARNARLLPSSATPAPPRHARARGVPEVLDVAGYFARLMAAGVRPERRRGSAASEMAHRQVPGRPGHRIRGRGSPDVRDDPAAPGPASADHLQLRPRGRLGSHQVGRGYRASGPPAAARDSPARCRPRPPRAPAAPSSSSTRIRAGCPSWLAELRDAEPDQRRIPAWHPGRHSRAAARGPGRFPARTPSSARIPFASA
ncbi:Transposase InsO and inactivated derivatives [Amycolatopsis rubida]|uniref:Transposase InsO and inactivated derivatives n=1 Tax=Amycolatopsis rubida TaxID=112413 RepID=A0A1I6BA52_9PSEU|nr:Transposase InsO and inactivated derivatives [Amycolatopsis rubida]